MTAEVAPEDLQFEKLSPLVQKKVETLQWMDNILGRIDYKHFVMEVLGHDFTQIHDPRVQWHLNRVGRVFKTFMQTRHTQKKFRKVMDIRPRGTCKSATVTIPVIPWIHLSEPELAGAIMSASYEKMALKFASAVKSTWEGKDPNSRLTDIYGDFHGKGRDRDWSVDKMVTSKRTNLSHADPTLAAYSVAQGPTSGHFKVFVLDDPVTEELMERDKKWLEKVWRAYIRLAHVIDNDGMLYLIMTRHHDADLVGMIIEEEIKPRVKAAELDNAPVGVMPKDWDNKTGWIKYAYLAGWEVFYDHVYDNYDAKTKKGDVVYPVIYSEEKIEDLRSTPAGEASFWSHLMNQPSQREDNPLKRSDIDKLYVPTIHDVPKRALRTIDIHCDFAFKNQENFLKQTGDETVAHIVAKDGGYVYRIHGWRGKVTQKMFGQELMKMIAWCYYDLDSKVRYVTYEQTMGHGDEESTRMWLHQLMQSEPDLPRFKPFPIKRNKQGNMGKWDRIENTNWAWQEGYVVLVEEAPHDDPLIYQMLNQKFAPHDDDADAFADCFHEGIYKKSPRTDIPEGFTQFMPGHGGWTPRPAVHGIIDPRTGRFEMRRRGALDTGKVDDLSGLNRMLMAQRFHTEDK